MNKKGAEKLLSMYWFIILILVAGGIFAMIYTFYHHPYDVREIEANILSNKIADCISQQGRINPSLLNGGNFNEEFRENFLKECGIVFEAEEKWKDEEQYYIGIDFYGIDDIENSLFNIFEGNLNWRSSCKSQEEFEKLSVCVNNKFYSVDEENNQYLIKILSIVRKTEKNVR